MPSLLMSPRSVGLWRSRPALRSTVAAVPVGNVPQGVGVDPTVHRAYVANSGSNTVTVIDTTTNTVVGTPIAVGAGPIAVAIGP